MYCRYKQHYKKKHTCGPRIQNSPLLLGPRGFPVFRSRILASVFGIKKPHDPGMNASSRVVHAVGDNSVMPHPSRIRMLGTFL